MELTKETRDRIYAAADALFEQNGRDAFPTVDAVRKAARVNMNDASSGMKEWRRAQTAQAAPVAVQVPEAVSAAGGQAVAVLWQQAQELANESLRAAQAGWEGERAELDAMRAELADAYETQATELEAVQEQNAELGKELATAGKQIEAQDKTLDEIAANLSASERRAALAEQKAEEIEHRARELRAELDRAHQEADRLRQERDQAVGRAKAAEAERDTARQGAQGAQAAVDAAKAHWEKTCASSVDDSLMEQFREDARKLLDRRRRQPPPVESIVAGIADRLDVGYTMGVHMDGVRGTWHRLWAAISTARMWGSPESDRTVPEIRAQFESLIGRPMSAEEWAQLAAHAHHHCDTVMKPLMEKVDEKYPPEGGGDKSP